MFLDINYDRLTTQKAWWNRLLDGCEYLSEGVREDAGSRDGPAFKKKLIKTYINLIFKS